MGIVAANTSQQGLVSTLEARGEVKMSALLLARVAWACLLKPRLLVRLNTACRMARCLKLGRLAFQSLSCLLASPKLPALNTAERLLLSLRAGF